jgi:hypothetical protein
MKSVLKKSDVLRKRLTQFRNGHFQKQFKQVKQFVGVCAYYHKFIQKYVDICSPLHDLTKGYIKGTSSNSFKWTPEHQKAFDTLITKLVEKTLMVWLDFTKRFTVTPDASNFAIGGVLSQDQGRGLQPIAYCSRKMLPAESRYPLHEQELLAIIYCFKKWRHYFLGDAVTVATDYYPLRYLATKPNLSGRQARWLDFLAEYDLSIEPQLGKDNTVADGLSRRLDYENASYSIILGFEWRIANKRTTTNNRLRGIIQSLYDAKAGQYSQLASRLNHEGNVANPVKETTADMLVALVSCTTQVEADIYKCLQQSYVTDAWAKPLITGAVKDIATPYGKYTVLNNLIYYVGKDERYVMYVPANTVVKESKIPLRQQLIQEAHGVLYSGHFGTAKTLYKLEQRFCWPNIDKDVGEYCTACIPCQRNKPSNRKPLGLLQPHELADTLENNKYGLYHTTTYEC